MVGDYYPGRLHKAFVIDPPSMFSVLWKVSNFKLSKFKVKYSNNFEIYVTKKWFLLEKNHQKRWSL